MGLLICNLAPGLKFRQDTLNTLKCVHSYFSALDASIWVVSCSFAVRTKNVENKPVVNERGKSLYSPTLPLSNWLILYAAIAHADNRPLPKPHFAALPIQPPPARLAPAVVQAISTAGAGSGLSHPRTSLVPVSRSHRMSSLGGGNGYQAFGINGPRRGLGVNNKIVESEGSQSGNLGFAMTEKEIDERVCYSLTFCFPLTYWKFLECRSRKRWRPQWRPKLPGDWQSVNVKEPNVKRRRKVRSRIR